VVKEKPIVTSSPLKRSLPVNNNNDKPKTNTVNQSNNEDSSGNINESSSPKGSPKQNNEHQKVSPSMHDPQCVSAVDAPKNIRK
jgi:hypothetical protein